MSNITAITTLVTTVTLIITLITTLITIMIIIVIMGVDTAVKTLKLWLQNNNSFFLFSFPNLTTPNPDLTRRP